MLSENYINLIFKFIYIIGLIVMAITIIRLLNKKNSYKNLYEINEMKNKLEEEQLKQLKMELKERELNLKDNVQKFETRKENFEIKASNIEEKLLNEKEKIELKNDHLELREKEVEMSEAKNRQKYEQELLILNGIDKKTAKELLFKHLNEKFANDIIAQTKHHKEELQLEKKNIASEILLSTMENIVVDTTNDNVLKQIKLPNDDIKGRLIGRAGRNIRSLETLLGVNVIIDDTPGVISVSSFNPVRRAIAMLTIDNLIDSGKINQVAIEDEVIKSTTKINDIILEKGREAIYKFNMLNVDIELVKVLGTLYYRTSYGQNVLEHSIECGFIAAKIANELGLDPNIAARCALFHDIGKVDSMETGKSHVELGIKIAKEFGEDECVINSIEAHHGAVDPTSAYAVITIIADKMSAGRIGSRRAAFEDYMERVTSLENIATSFDGVDKAYALQGGREIRVMVEQNSISDDAMPVLANEIKNKIEENITFPGIIVVNMIRETRVRAEATKESLILKEFNEQ